MDRRLDILATSVHAVIGALNALAFGYNWLGAKRGRALFHGAIVLYEVHAVYEHLKEEGDEKRRHHLLRQV